MKKSRKSGPRWSQSVRIKRRPEKQVVRSRIHVARQTSGSLCYKTSGREKKSSEQIYLVREMAAFARRPLSNSICDQPVRNVSRQPRDSIWPSEGRLLRTALWQGRSPWGQVTAARREWCSVVNRGNWMVLNEMTRLTLIMTGLLQASSAALSCGPLRDKQLTTLSFETCHLRRWT